MAGWEAPAVLVPATEEGRAGKKVRRRVSEWGWGWRCGQRLETVLGSEVGREQV